jgi:exopolysaccharide biosynthesis protein
MAHWKRGLSCLRASARYSKRLFSYMRRYRHPALQAAFWLLLLVLLCGPLALSLSDHWVSFPLHGRFWRRGSLARVFSLTQTVTSGVVETTEKQQTAAGMQRINLLNVDLTNTNIRLGVVQAQNQMVSAGETLSSMASRTGAVAGINGDFFEINGSGDSLGMVEINGRIWQSPGAFAVLGITSAGRLTIGRESFSGSVTAGGSSYPLRSVNRYHDAGTNALALFTPDLGISLSFHSAALAMLQPVAGSSTTLRVTSVQSGVASLPRLHTQDALVGSGAAGAWLTTHLQPGATITLTEQITPDSNLIQAIGGGPILIKDGARYHDLHSPMPGEARTRDPLTAVGITRDGTHALLVVCDGHQADAGQSRGLTHAEMVSYLLAHGAYQAMLFDSGGSSEMVARLPGQRQISVLNSLSDGHERPVANGLFLYSTEKQPEPAASVVVNDGKPLTLFTGEPAPISASDQKRWDSG